MGFVVQLRHGNMSIGHYYARIQGMWREPALYKPAPKGQEKDVEDQCIYDFRKC